MSGIDTRGVDASSVGERNTRGSRVSMHCNDKRIHDSHWTWAEVARLRLVDVVEWEWACGSLPPYACRSAILSGILLAGRLGCMW